MSMSKNIARLAVTAGLTAALSFGGVMAPVTMAFAADGDNSITITQSEGNASATFKAYQIFTADVVDPTEAGATDKIVSNVKWAFDDVDTQNAIIAAIKEDSKYKTSDPKPNIVTAQDVADWLTKNVTGTTAETVVNKDHLLNKIAAIVKKDVEATGNPFSTGDSFTVPNDDKNSPKTGYYLFLTDESSLGTPEAAKKNTGTSPIFAVVGGSSVTVTEKTSIPTVDKQVLEGTKWGKVSDSHIGEEVEYKLTGSVANNIDTFKKYEYEFQDTLSKGLEVVKDSSGTPKDLRVCIVDSKTNAEREVVLDATHGYQVTVTPGTTAGTELLKVSFANLKAVQDANGNQISVNADSTVVVTYKAKLNSQVEYKADGATNAVKVIYSNNPMTENKGTSESDEVTDYVFGLDVTKTASDDPHKKLVAGFKVKMTKEGTASIDGEKWLTAAGGLTSNANEAGVFRTAESDSKVFIPGLVAGEYEITECETPAGYNSISFTITVTPTYDPTTGKLTNLKVTDTSDMVTTDLDKKVDSTKIPVIIQNKKGSGLPLTGLNGVTFTWIAGGAVLCIGVAHLIRSRKQAEESEQE